MTCRQQDCAFAGSKIAPLQDALSSFLFSRLQYAPRQKKGKAKNLKIEQTTKTKKKQDQKFKIHKLQRSPIR